MLGTKTAQQALGTLGTLEILETSGVAKTPGKPCGSLVEALGTAPILAKNVQRNIIILSAANKACEKGVQWQQA
jgi:hypothetical protein